MQSPSSYPESGANGQSTGSKSKSSAKATVEGSHTNMSHELYNFLADVEDLVKGTTSLAGEDLVLARERLNARIEAAKESVEAMGSAIVQRTQQTATVTNEYVHEQPWKAIGASAAVAFLFGFVLARR